MRIVQTLSFACLFLLAACGRDADVVLYCSVDKAHSEPIVRAFEQQTGLKVEFTTDVEANKSVGLRRRILEEAGNPRCDVFWNNEVVQTAMLAEKGLLEPFDSPSAAGIPATFKDPQRMWIGFGARARVLIVNTAKLPDAAGRPSGTADFVDPAFEDRACMAKPLTGTTAAHAAWWIATRGLDATLELLGDMRENGVSYTGGNAHVMKLVREGEYDFGWTDTDDAKAAVDEGFPVTVVVPDQGAGEPGVLLIPNTVSRVKGGRHPEAAQKLIDFLLSEQVEAMLAAGDSAQIPVRDGVERPAGVLSLAGMHVADVDWTAVGHAYAEHAADLEAFFNQ